MEYEEYRRLYNGLKGFEDVARLEELGYDSRLVRTLYTQKTSRDVKKRFHIVKQNSKKMLKEWKNGKTMMELAEKWRFPPVMTAMFLFLEDGASKKEFWGYINDPDLLRSDVAEELREVISKDIVYSPAGNEEQRQRGIWGETLLQNWLDEQGIGYRTEKDIRGEYEKTPDALLDEPMMYGDKKIYWVESKASFGDNTEFKYNSRHQLEPYTRIFGPGVVVYWVGKLDDLECPPDVYVEDISILKKRLGRIEE
ncbi:MAG: TPD domain-containing protein [Candidatus Methanomethylophilaceae archaeon]|nr:TPD domain-containing protein [Candidatus Methanomethylophilaceae archaeon]MDY5872934.1 TPD domain-containing protein [Candidatus Methanomethylophilaceae archaeon]